MPENDSQTRSRSRLAVYVAWAAVLNVPFLVCHPASPLIELPLVRSLVVGLVLFILPGLPWLGIMIGRGRRIPLKIVWVMAASLGVQFCVLLAFRWLPLSVSTLSLSTLSLSTFSLSSSGAWNAVWLATDIALLGNLLVGGPPACGVPLRATFWRTGIPLFLMAYVLFFYGATRVVPMQEEHDLDVLGSGYPLLTRFEPLLVGDYHTVYQFAHPPLFHYYVAGSFLYFDQLPYLAYYDRAAQRSKAAMGGEPFVPFDGEVNNLSKGTGAHHVLGVDGADYLIAPPLSDGSTRMPVVEFEHAVIAAYYEAKPNFIEARTPAIFLSAMTVALLGCWVFRVVGNWWLAMLIPLAYATNPEVFVRSSLAGYTAVTAFLALVMLISTGAYQSDRRRVVWWSCFLTAMLAGLANQKLILLAAATFLWQLLTHGQSKLGTRLAVACRHPIVVGYAAGMALFWAFGLWVNAAVFWKEHVGMHFLDRITHVNPLGYGGYPTTMGLWVELLQHTGYLLLPAGIAAIVLGCFNGRNGPSSDDDKRVQEVFILWALWAIIAAVVFTLVDWRQTKHLIPVVLVLYLAVTQWATRQRGRMIMVGGLFTFLLLWNVWTLRILAMDFESYPVTPCW